MFKVNNKNTSVSIVEFEQVNVRWVSTNEKSIEFKCFQN